MFVRLPQNLVRRNRGQGSGPACCERCEEPRPLIGSQHFEILPRGGARRIYRALCVPCAREHAEQERHIIATMAGRVA